MYTEPDKSFVMGGTYRVPVMAGLLDKDFVKDLSKDVTYNMASFDQEYRSIWEGSAVDAFFNGEAFDRNRILQKPELSANGRNGPLEYYILGVDVGRFGKTKAGTEGCPSVVTVVKVKPSAYGMSQKLLVAVYSFANTSFDEQAVIIKKLYYKYNAKRLVIDANGLGAGLIDFMVLKQPDENLPSFGVINDEENRYKKHIDSETEQDAIYVIKATAPINTIMYATMQTQLLSGKIKFLIDEKVAKAKLSTTTMSKKMTNQQKEDYLKMNTLTSKLRSEMINMREKHDGVNIILESVNKNIGHDTVSSLGYALYYIKELEDSKQRNKRKFTREDLARMSTRARRPLAR